MKVGEWLAQATKKLEKTGISTARLDCLVLLEDATGKDRSWLLSHPTFHVRGLTFHMLEEQVGRRARHEPLAYIRGKSEFYGREFLVNEHTLQPRPETETMIEMLLKRKPKKVIDVGTGSGCIAITAKLTLIECEVIATDISSPCLVVAKKNAKKLKATVSFLQTNLISQLDNKRLDNSVLCCNLPYVPASFTINRSAMFEPEIAIYGGKDGLDYYRQLFVQLEQKNSTPSAILTESLPTQHLDLQKIAHDYGYTLDEVSDFIQAFVPAT